MLRSLLQSAGCAEVESLQLQEGIVAVVAV